MNELTILYKTPWGHYKAERRQIVMSPDFEIESIDPQTFGLPRDHEIIAVMTGQIGKMFVRGVEQTI